MGQVIALAGKGGTGKTTLAALFVRIIKEKKLGSVLAVDADPNSNLAEVLGLEIKESIGSILDDLADHPQSVPVNMGKDAFIEYRVQTAIAEGDNFDVLTMGRPEGPGCYCYVNNALRNVMGKLVKDYDFVVIDNEAGLEHLSRRTTGQADTLVVVSDATVVGLKAAKRIAALTRELGLKIKKDFLIVNRCGKALDKEKTRGLNLELLGALSNDPEIEGLSLDGDSLFKLNNNNLTLTALGKLGDRIWHCN
ncbi:MAG: AAA family ATPase [Candidatus Omnitrophica bacterium]|nr:AAA family ATPase [Candidatus Omnitrophota bacterium]MDD5027036.1 AAA family ATPase [Candidatus Omnitrophota bacterium]MDD5661838.1 AAA family ATPase [Candidatus Omnitrophota bacterium]